MQTLLQRMQESLASFKASRLTFKVLATVKAPTSEVIEPKALKPDERPRTLLILDSSFNPPSIAHCDLARTAIRDYATLSRHARPHRLLLLFSTSNADKAATAASFDERLVMMALFAQDVVTSLASEKVALAIPVDIGLTTAPYYTDKSIAIEQEGKDFYSSEPRHIHLVGFDTLIRIFTAKYYAKFNPPFAALEPFFSAGHELMVTLRPDQDEDSLTKQQAFLTKIEHGELESKGGSRGWAKQIHLMPPTSRAGISSTKIRQAADEADWTSVQNLCTPSIAEWLQARKLY